MFKKHYLLKQKTETIFSLNSKMDKLLYTVHAF